MRNVFCFRIPHSHFRIHKTLETCDEIRKRTGS